MRALVFKLLPPPFQQMGFRGHKNIPTFRPLDSLSLWLSIHFTVVLITLAFCVSVCLIHVQFVRISPVILAYVTFLKDILLTATLFISSFLFKIFQLFFNFCRPQHTSGLMGDLIF